MGNTTGKVFKIVEADVSHERLDGEVIAVNMKTGRYYSISGSSADVWSLMQAGVPMASWGRILGAGFGKDIATDDISDFINACVDAGLITETADAQNDNADLPSDYARLNWVKPRLEEFDDMQDLILVDPIHDITQLGWPHTKE